MFSLMDAEMLATLGLDQCWFYPERISDRLQIKTLIRLFCQEIFTGMPIGERCAYFVKNRNYIKLLKSTAEGWELETLSAEASKPFLALEWLATL